MKFQKICKFFNWLEFEICIKIRILSKFVIKNKKEVFPSTLKSAKCFNPYWKFLISCSNRKFWVSTRNSKFELEMLSPKFESHLTQIFVLFVKCRIQIPNTVFVLRFSSLNSKLCLWTQLGIKSRFFWICKYLQVWLENNVKKFAASWLDGFLKSRHLNSRFLEKIFSKHQSINFDFVFSNNVS